jgi:all-trans-8'-apo-beta-carotenal 15,15'-oxygenase
MSFWSRTLAETTLGQRSVISIEGHWPESLHGSLLRNGPALFQRGSEKQAHLFDGDGLIQRWTFNGGCFSHEATWVYTKKFQQEESAQQFLYAGLASNSNNRRPIRRPDDINTANTNIIHFDNKLYALWEAGSAYELNPTDLSSIGPRTWSAETAGAPFGAHPKIDRNGELWNVGISNNILLIYRIKPNGALDKLATRSVGNHALVHDFALTECYILVWLAPLYLDKHKVEQGSTMLDAMEWHSQQPSRLLCFDRHSLALHKELELEAELIFHFANAWDEGNQVYLHYVSSSFEELRDGLMRTDSRLAQVKPRPPSRAVLHQVDLSSGLSQRHEWPEDVEFPQIDLRLLGRRHRSTFHLTRGPSACGSNSFNGVQHTDLNTGNHTRWEASSHLDLEEHVHVPSKATACEGAGWLVGTGFDAHRGASFCSVFNAESIESGPLAMAYLDGPVPACLHGQFMANVN